VDRPSGYENGTYRVLQTCAVIRLKEVEIYGSGKDVFGFRLQKRGGERERGRERERERPRALEPAGYACNLADCELLRVRTRRLRELVHVLRASHPGFLIP
jgi:hypothetical protein